MRLTRYGWKEPDKSGVTGNCAESSGIQEAESFRSGVTGYDSLKLPARSLKAVAQSQSSLRTYR
jgi:hypothetical protein